jgi:hypothetical protein
MIIKKFFLNKNNDSDEKNFFFVDFKDVFIYNLEKFSLLFHDVFEFFNLLRIQNVNWQVSFK